MVKKKSSAGETIGDMVPLFYQLAITSAAIPLIMEGLGPVFAEPIRKRMLEFKKMGVIELEFIDKNEKTRVEYHPIVRIKEWVDNFLKKNPKWVAEKEDIYEIKTGRWILTRVYRKYNKKWVYDDEDECCPECGREY